MKSSEELWNLMKSIETLWNIMRTCNNILGDLVKLVKSCVILLTQL